MGRHLRRLDWGLLRPVLSINSPDPQYEVKADELELLKERARRGEIILLFEDEVDINRLPGITRCWTRRGEQRKVLTPGSNQKRYGFGAVHFVDGSLVSYLGEHKDSAGFCHLVEAIVSRYCPGPVWDGPWVVLVADNYIIHKSKLSQETLGKYADRLEVFNLPTYSPKLNLIEWLWKYLRSKVTHNHFFASIEAMLDAIHQFFGDLAQNPDLVLSIIGAKPNAQPNNVPKDLCPVI